MQIPEKELEESKEPQESRKLTEEEKRQLELKDAIARYNQKKKRSGLLLPAGIMGWQEA